MGDPLTTSIAVAVVTGASAAVSDGTRALLTNLAALLRERFRRRRSEQDTLAAAFRDPADEAQIQRLAHLIGEHLRDDPVFAQQVRTLWHDIHTTSSGHGSAVTNVVSGPTHGSVVQARDIHGGINFGAPPPPPSP